MRDIKFRIWDKVGKRMGKVTSIDSAIDEVDHPKVFFIVKRTKQKHRIETFRNNKMEEFRYIDQKDDKYILMQYIGITDANGTGIYEGDILAYKSLRNGESHVMGYVKYDEVNAEYRIFSNKENGYITMPCRLSAILDDLPQKFCPLPPSSAYTVVGNIYENPELAEEEHND